MDFTSTVVPIEPLVVDAISLFLRVVGVVHGIDRVGLKGGVSVDYLVDDADSDVSLSERYGDVEKDMADLPDSGSTLGHSSSNLIVLIWPRKLPRPSFPATTLPSYNVAVPGDKGEGDVEEVHRTSPQSRVHN